MVIDTTKIIVSKIETGNTDFAPLTSHLISGHLEKYNGCANGANLKMLHKLYSEGYNKLRIVLR